MDSRAESAFLAASAPLTGPRMSPSLTEISGEPRDQFIASHESAGRLVPDTPSCHAGRTALGSV